jgi:two-component system chemotaxis response regulator CheY
MKLLAVDDSNIVRSRIARLAQGGPLGSIRIVGLARNGIEALRVARATQPDLVTMDLTMPEMDGLDCIPQLLRICPHANVLVISALSDKSTAIRALKLGARGFLAKPFSDEQLQLALQSLVDPTGQAA